MCVCGWICTIKGIFHHNRAYLLSYLPFHAVRSIFQSLFYGPETEKKGEFFHSLTLNLGKLLNKIFKGARI